ncbi:SE1561 family protein [Sporosarcina sp. HYO08]|uniref:SE1561 family protein n=1 Tax=Sporosarcina sp. HYO08 TaxID=1759557 RepID=UPI000798A6CA|nr:SE1561 family protein [Sporosarcina sp. HYO08]KXH78829.1 hypothetical protein AU377_12580 [Sporosarcina sp. HYO08]
MNDKSNGSHVEGLKIRLHQFLESLDAIEPETADLQEIDRLIDMIDELEEQMEKIKKTDQ